MLILFFGAFLFELGRCGFFAAAFPSTVSPGNETKENYLIFPNEGDNFVPKCSNDRSFCEDVERYPEDKFFKILETTPYEQEYFHSQPVDDTGDDFTHRFHTDKKRYICESQKSRYYPKVAENAKKVWKFVYNFDKYKQEVTTEECVSTGSCTLLPGVPKHLKTRCVQRYSDRLLLVADKDGNPEWDLFWFPSACVCTYKPLGTFKSVE